MGLQAKLPAVSRSDRATGAPGDRLYVRAVPSGVVPQFRPLEVRAEQRKRRGAHLDVGSLLQMPGSGLMLRMISWLPAVVRGPTSKQGIWHSRIIPPVSLTPPQLASPSVAGSKIQAPELTLETSKPEPKAVVPPIAAIVLRTRLPEVSELEGVVRYTERSQLRGAPGACGGACDGKLLFRWYFGASGALNGLRVVGGLRHGLDEAALHTAEQIRFKPVRKDQSADSIVALAMLF